MLESFTTFLFSPDFLLNFLFGVEAAVMEFTAESCGLDVPRSTRLVKIVSVCICVSLQGAEEL